MDGLGDFGLWGGLFGCGFFGCGFGFLGLLIMPYLPEGSTYTGVDFAEGLLEEGKKLFADKNYEVNFIHLFIFQF